MSGVPPSLGRVFLVGMMGSGKSTVGRALAARTGVRYVDNDDLLRRATGRTARELLAEGGTPAVREGEGDALALGIDEPPPVIVGVAAGVVLEPDDRRRLAEAGTVVWLRAGVDTLTRRTVADADDPEGRHRPWHGGGVGSARAWFAEENARRGPLYASIAEITVDVEASDGTDRETRALVDEILEALRARHPTTG